MHNKILVCEDDKDIVELLKLYLESNNFLVTSAYDGIEALDKFKNNKYDVIIMDIMMPKINGYEVIKTVRQSSDIPVIIISAKNLDSDKVLGLDIGADAYITKPFNPLEVVAYVKALIRRGYEFSLDSGSNPDIVIGDLVLQMDKYLLKKRDEIVPLTSTELKIIAKMMQNSGKVFTKSQLYECISGDYFESDDNTMMVHISNIRSKIEDNPANPSYIITVRGLGYKFENKEKGI